MGADKKEIQMIKTQLTVLPILVFQMFSTVNDFHKEIPVPVKLTEERGRIEARIALELLNAPKERLEKLVHACELLYTAL